MSLLRFGQKEESWTCLKWGGFSGHTRDGPCAHRTCCTPAPGRRDIMGGSANPRGSSGMQRSLEVAGAAAEPQLLREGRETADDAIPASTERGVLSGVRLRA